MSRSIFDDIVGRMGRSLSKMRICRRKEFKEWFGPAVFGRYCIVYAYLYGFYFWAITCKSAINREARRIDVTNLISYHDHVCYRGFDKAL